MQRTEGKLEEAQRRTEEEPKKSIWKTSGKPKENLKKALEKRLGKLAYPRKTSQKPKETCGKNQEHLRET